MKIFHHKNRRAYAVGFTLIEALALLALFGITTIAFYRTYTAAALQIIEAKRRTAAVALANERMEQIRNIPYNEIGISGGSPDGRLDPDESALVNDINFRMILSVVYIDDPNDGVIGDGSDTTGHDDYKRVKIYVAWGEAIDVTASEVISPTYESKRIELTSTFTPPGGLEGPSENGVLSINTIESDGALVPNVSVGIYCAGCGSGGADIDTIGDGVALETDSTANLFYSTRPSSGGDVSSSNYEIILSKSGYETIRTEIPYDAATQLYNPINEHLTVLLGELTTATFIMNRKADFDVSVRDPFCNALATAGPYSFDMEGGRVLGTDPSQSPSVDVTALDDFFGNQTVTTDNNGDVRIYTDTDADGAIELNGDDAAGNGSYSIDRIDFETNYSSLTFWKLVPGDEIDPTVTQVEGTAANCNFIVLDNTVDGIFLTIRDESDVTNPFNVEDATIRLRNVALGYSATIETDKFGKGYFPSNDSETVSPGVYELRVTKDGYDEYQELVTLSAGLNLETIILDPS